MMIKTRQLFCLIARNSLSRKYICSSVKIQSSRDLTIAEQKTNDVRKNKSRKDNFSIIIPNTEFRERQERLIQLINLESDEVNKPRLCLISSADRAYQADTQIPSIHYKQNSDFIYFTGLNSSDSANCVLALLSENGEDLKSVIFAPFLTEHEKLWEGAGLMTSENLSNIKYVSDSVEDINNFSQFITTHGSHRLFLSRYGLPRLRKSRARALDCFDGKEYQSLSPFIDHLRLFKSESELRTMRRTGSIGARALRDTMCWTHDQHSANTNDFNLPLINEGQIAAKFDYEVRVNGASKIAYPSVCAGAHRSTTIHYGCNNRFLSSNDWILMDAGCEDIEGYNSDITRCWQIDGGNDKSKLQFALYQALLEVHEKLIDSVEVGVTSLDSLFQLMCNLIGKILIEFRICNEYTSESDAAKLAYYFCPHHVSHYLGLDVHDSPTVDRSIALQPGICFTIEPGLYFRHTDNVRDEFKGIGLRIEDDFIINKDSELENLTQDCPYIIKHD